MIHKNSALLGILGNPVHHSLSPLMHNAVFNKLGIQAVYLPFEVARDRLGEAAKGLRALGFCGVNVTIPFKEEIISYLDDLSPEAALYQAVNVVAIENQKMVGYNTDGPGFIMALQEAGAAQPKRCLLLGAGGAARSITIALAQTGARQITILDIDEAKADQLAEFVSSQTNSVCSAAKAERAAFHKAAADADLIVNCTPVGMFPRVEDSPVESLEALPSQAVVCDIIYNPLETRLLAMAREKGLKTINGLPMFVHQGALTLKILLGVDAPVEFMKEVVRSGLETPGSDSD